MRNMTTLSIASSGADYGLQAGDNLYAVYAEQDKSHAAHLAYLARVARGAHATDCGADDIRDDPDDTGGVRFHYGPAAHARIQPIQRGAGGQRLYPGAIRIILVHADGSQINASGSAAGANRYYTDADRFAGASGALPLALIWLPSAWT